jgi:hypothetical protein
MRVNIKYILVDPMRQEIAMRLRINASRGLSKGKRRDFDARWRWLGWGLWNGGASRKCEVGIKAGGSRDPLCASRLWIFGGLAAGGGQAQAESKATTKTNVVTRM